MGDEEANERLRCEGWERRSNRASGGYILDDQLSPIRVCTRGKTESTAESKESVPLPGFSSM